MVSEEHSGAEYVSNSEGAPPLPPAGGYRGASRASRAFLQQAEEETERTETVTLDRPRRRPHWLGWVALGAAIVFGVVLAVLVLIGAASAVYGVTALVVQLLVAAAVIAALIVPRARRLGIAALAVALVANVATLGGVGALQVASAGSYVDEKSPAQQHRQGFPGVDGYSEEEILAQPSLEEERAEVEALFADIRDALSAEYGVTWTKTGTEEARPERNGRGGESMLLGVVFDSWTTNEPVHDLAQKEAMLDTVAEVVMDHGYPAPFPLNENDGTFPESQMAHLYGSSDPSEQAIWERASWDGWSPTIVRATITDLSRDPTGDFRRTAEAQRERPGDPIEGLTLLATSSPLLSEQDVDEFKDRMRAY